MMTHPKIRVGLTGAGNEACSVPIPALPLLPEYELVANNPFTATEENSIKVAVDQCSWIQSQIPDKHRMIPRSTLDTSVQDLAQLYRGFTQEWNGSGTRLPDSYDGACLHHLIDLMERSSREGKSIVIGEPS